MTLTLKEKIANSQQKERLKIELANYKAALKQTGPFTSYHEVKIIQITKQLNEIKAVELIEESTNVNTQ